MGGSTALMTALAANAPKAISFTATTGATPRMLSRAERRRPINGGSHGAGDVLEAGKSVTLTNTVRNMAAGIDPANSVDKAHGMIRIRYIMEYI